MIIPQLACVYRGALVMVDRVLSNDEDIGDVAGELVHAAVIRSTASRDTMISTGYGRTNGYDGM
jgi:hypothetical protein